MPERTLLFEAIRDATDPVAVFERVVHQCLTLLPHADGASLEMRRDADTLEYVAASGTLAPFIGLRLSVHKSFSGLTARTGEVQLCHDARDDDRVSPEAVAATGVISMLCVPLSEQPENAAVLKVSSRIPHAFTDTDTRTLRQIAEFLRITLGAAQQIASATANVMQGNLASVDLEDSDASLRTARFVANVMTPGLVDRIDAANLIEEVLDQRALDIALQPVFDLRTGHMRGLEALARFPHSDHAPDWWFALAHRVGHGVELELLAAERALELLPQIPAPVRMSLNTGPETAVDPRFEALFDGIDTSRITVELTEHDLVEDYPRLLEVIGTLRQRGIALSVDDAGSGYSGLSHIRQLLPDVIKLDRDLTAGIDTDAVRQALATALVAFAERIGAIVIAEGIENASEAEMIRQLGVGFGQGYFLGRPAPVETWFPPAS